MESRRIYCAGSTKAAMYAAAYLSSLGLPITKDSAQPVGHVLLDVPSFGPSGLLRDGSSVESLLAQLPSDVIIYGGNLIHPALSNYTKVDFLKDDAYLAENAYITAECALDVALPYLSITLRRCPTLILGWGRIGKCLGQLLKSIGADVTIAARKETDRVILKALGYGAADPTYLSDALHHYRLILNTVPKLILTNEDMQHCRPDAVKIDLASTQGMDDEDVILARGLPGLHLPESSGKLIAETFIKHYKKEDTI